jgi:hypothetical protein
VSSGQEVVQRLKEVSFSRFWVPCFLEHEKQVSVARVPFCPVCRSRSGQDSIRPLAAIRSRRLGLDTLAGHVTEFAGILTDGTESGSVPWMAAVDPDLGRPDLHSFTAAARTTPSCRCAPRRCWPSPSATGQRPGVVKVSVPEARLLLRLAATPMSRATRDLGYAWSRWRRRHQARARWHHYHAQLKAARVT